MWERRNKLKTMPGVLSVVAGKGVFHGKKGVFNGKWTDLEVREMYFETY